MGWARDDTLATSLPLAALDMARTQRRPSAGLVHHCARGVQPSMSRRGNCCDNAAMESFGSSLKRELVHRARFVTRAAARAAVFGWSELFYNRERLHSALGFQSPVDFEKQLNWKTHVSMHSPATGPPNRGKARRRAGCEPAELVRPAPFRSGLAGNGHNERKK